MAQHLVGWEQREEGGRALCRSAGRACCLGLPGQGARDRVNWQHDLQEDDEQGGFPLARQPRMRGLGLSPPFPHAAAAADERGIVQVSSRRSLALSIESEGRCAFCAPGGI